MLVFEITSPRTTVFIKVLTVDSTWLRSSIGVIPFGKNNNLEEKLLVISNCHFFSQKTKTYITSNGQIFLNFFLKIKGISKFINETIFVKKKGGHQGSVRVNMYTAESN